MLGDWKAITKVFSQNRFHSFVIFQNLRNKLTYKQTWLDFLVNSCFKAYEEGSKYESKLTYIRHIGIVIL